MTDLFTEVSADRGMERGLWTRRTFVALFAVIAALAFWGLFGQRETESVARGGGAPMTLSVPAAVRGGLYYQATVDITTTVPIEHPRLVLRGSNSRSTPPIRAGARTRSSSTTRSARSRASTAT